MSGMIVTKGKLFNLVSKMLYFAVVNLLVTYIANCVCTQVLMVSVSTVVKAIVYCGFQLFHGNTELFKLLREER